MKLGAALLGLTVLGCATQRAPIPHYQLSTVGQYTVYSGTAGQSRYTVYAGPEQPIVFYADKTGDGFELATDQFGVLRRKPTKDELKRISGGIGLEMLIPAAEGNGPLGCIDNLAGFTACSDAERLEGIMILHDVLREIRKEQGNDWFFKTG